MKKSNQMIYLVMSLLLVIVFLTVGSSDALDPTNNKGYLAFKDGRMIELRHINNYINDKLDGINTEDTIKETLKEEVDYIVVSDKKILEIEDKGDSYKVKINLNVFIESFYMYAYFEKNEVNDILKDFKSGDKISFKSNNLNKVGFNSDKSLKYIVFTDVEVTNKEDN